jgi:hypothetical protein
LPAARGTALASSPMAGTTERHVVVADKTNKRIARVLYRLEMHWENHPDQNLREVLVRLGDGKLPSDRKILALLEDEDA